MASPNIHEVVPANAYNEKEVNVIDKKEVNVVDKNFEAFKKYYENASDEEKGKLNEKFNTYLDEELQNDPKLKDKLNNIDESSEITKEDIDNLNTVKSLTDVLNDYPDISSSTYRAVRKMVDEYIKDLNEKTKDVTNPENKE